MNSRASFQTPLVGTPSDAPSQIFPPTPRPDHPDPTPPRPHPRTNKKLKPYWNSFNNHNLYTNRTPIANDSGRPLLFRRTSPADTLEYRRQAVTQRRITTTSRPSIFQATTFGGIDRYGRLFEESSDNITPRSIPQPGQGELMATLSRHLHAAPNEYHTSIAENGTRTRELQHRELRRHCLRLVPL